MVTKNSLMVTVVPIQCFIIENRFQNRLFVWISYKPLENKNWNICIFWHNNVNLFFSNTVSCSWTYIHLVHLFLVCVIWRGVTSLNDIPTSWLTWATLFIYKFIYILVVHRSLSVNSPSLYFIFIKSTSNIGFNQ